MANMIDMARTETKEDTSPLMMDSKYSYGLQITLDKDALAKLGVDQADWEIGDVFPLDILAKVTSKSMNESENGQPYCSVSLQITHIGAEEIEEDDNADAEPSLAKHGYDRITYGK